MLRPTQLSEVMYQDAVFTIYRLWFSDCHAYLQPLQEVLNSDERQRAQRFVYPEHRERYILARGFLRVLLAEHLKVSAADIEFCCNEFGKPALVGNYDGAWHFNLSHSQDMALFAVGKEPVGIDVEFVRKDCECLAIAERFFSSVEVEQLRSLAACEQREAFFRCWTRKEAFIKALGVGLSFPLGSFDVDIASGTSNISSQSITGSLREQSLLAVRDHDIQLDDWLLTSLNVDSRYAAAWCKRVAAQ